MDSIEHRTDANSTVFNDCFLLRIVSFSNLGDFSLPEIWWLKFEYLSKRSILSHFINYSSTRKFVSLQTETVLDVIYFCTLILITFSSAMLRISLTLLYLYVLCRLYIFVEEGTRLSASV